jgi:hypothetical protein
MPADAAFAQTTEDSCSTISYVSLSRLTTSATSSFHRIPADAAFAQTTEDSCSTISYVSLSRLTTSATSSFHRMPADAALAQTTEDSCSTISYVSLSRLTTRPSVFRVVKSLASIRVLAARQSLGTRFKPAPALGLHCRRIFRLTHQAVAAWSRTHWPEACLLWRFLVATVHVRHPSVRLARQFPHG